MATRGVDAGGYAVGQRIVGLTAGQVQQFIGAVAPAVQWFPPLDLRFVGTLRLQVPERLLALKTLPQMLASIAGLMLLCGAIAWLLTKLLLVDLLTTYLAISPGGLDTVAIIAAGSQINIGFVMAMQSLRLFAILLVGPAMERFISRNFRPAPGPAAICSGEKTGAHVASGGPGSAIPA